MSSARVLIYFLQKTLHFELPFLPPNPCRAMALRLRSTPYIMTPHTLRHTFYTNLANAGMNPKALQYIMGHSNITMMLNYYAHATFASARAEMERLIAA